MASVVPPTAAAAAPAEAPAAADSSSEYARGSVVRILLRAFLTYDDVEVAPGPRLNLVIGPNGTGKSTLVAALVLGLGGAPALLGRASRLQHFVKDGYDEALVELELCEPHADHNTVVRREFNRAGHSTWRVNGRPATHKQVARVVAELNIQVDNLCQMLPQERVQDFSRLEPMALLESTERAAGYAGMLDDHRQLSTAAAETGQLRRSADETGACLASCQQKMAALQAAADHELERQQCQRQLQLLRHQLDWRRYRAAVEEQEGAASDHRAATGRLKQSERQLAPLRRAMQQCESLISGCKVKLTALEAQAAVQQRDVDGERTAFDTEEERLQRVDSELERLLVTEQQRQSRCEQLHQKLVYNRGQLEKQLQLLNSESAGGTAADGSGYQQLDQQLQRVEQHMATLNVRMSQRQERRDANWQRRQQLLATSERLACQLHKLQNVVDRRLQLLRVHNADIYQAVMWLRENKARFTGTINEPIVLLLDIPDSRMACYVNACIPWRDMLAFTCDDKQTMNAFIEEIRDRQKLRISCLYMNPGVISQRFEPAYSRELLCKVGFTHSVADLFTCSDLLRAHLLATYNLHNVPVACVPEGGAAAVMKAMRVHQLRMRTFMIAATRYRVRQSHYTNNELMVSEQLRPVNEMLTTRVDSGQVQQLQQQLEAARHELRQVEQQTDEAAAGEEEECAQLEMLRREKKSLCDARNSVRHLQMKIRGTETSLAECSAAQLDVDKERAAAAHRKRQLLSAMLQCVQRHARTCSRVESSLAGGGATRLQLELACTLRHTLKLTLAERTGALDTLRAQLQSSAGQLERCRQLAQQLRSTVLAALKATSDEQALQLLGWRKLSALPSLAELEELVHERQARAQMLSDGDGDDDDGGGGQRSALNEYRRLQSEHEQLQQRAAEQQAQLAALHERWHQLGTRWLAAVRRLVDQVSAAFAGFFSQLGCAGQVVLTQRRPGAEPLLVDPSATWQPTASPATSATSSLDVSQLGVSVRVQYRAAEPLRELSPMHHSGGERSVATMVYLVALQTVSGGADGGGVPFRCVDEVNQGMDETNERRMFEFVVATVSHKLSGQYFLVTPKLLANLTYPDSLKVLCVFNSPTMLSHRHFSMKLYYRTQRKRKQPPPKSLRDH